LDTSANPTVEFSDESAFMKREVDFIEAIDRRFPGVDGTEFCASGATLKLISRNIGGELGNPPS